MLILLLMYDFFLTMTKWFRLLLLVYMLTCPAVVFSQKKEKKAKRKKDKIEQSSILIHPEVPLPDLDVKKIYFKATQKFVAGDYQKAMDEYQRCAKLAPNNAAVKYKIGHCLFALRNYTQAESFLLQAISLDKKNRHFYTLLVEVYANLGEYQKVIETYKAGLKNVPNATEWYYELAGSYLYLGKNEDALKTYQEAEAILGIEETIIRQKQRIYLGERNYEQALKESQKLINAFPTEKRFILDHAELLSLINRNQEAQIILQNLVSDEEYGSQAKFQLAILYIRQKEYQQFLNIVHAVILDPNLVLDSRIELLEVVFKMGVDSLYGQFLPMVAQLAESHPNLPRIQFVHGDYLLASGQDKQARNAYKKALELDANLVPVWMQLLNLDLKNMWASELIEDAEEAISAFPYMPQFYLFAGLGYTLKKEYPKAARILEQGRKLASETDLELDIVAQLADVYHYLGENELSDQSFEVILTSKPSDAHALNNYSYFLALRGQKLDIARANSGKLIALFPNNPTYLDTHGWVLYKLGQYVEAEKYLAKAVAINPNSGVINEHYGDVLFRLGRIDEAVIFWKKAKELGGSEDEKKLNFKLVNRTLE